MVCSSVINQTNIEFYHILQIFAYTSKKQLINLLNICVEWVNGRLEYIKCETGGGQWDYNNSVRPQVRLEIKTEYDGKLDYTNSVREEV